MVREPFKMDLRIGNPFMLVFLSPSLILLLSLSLSLSQYPFLILLSPFSTFLSIYMSLTLLYSFSSLSLLHTHKHTHSHTQTHIHTHTQLICYFTNSLFFLGRSLLVICHLEHVKWTMTQIPQDQLKLFYVKTFFTATDLFIYANLVIM